MILEKLELFDVKTWEKLWDVYFSIHKIFNALDEMIRRYLIAEKS